MYKFLNFCGGEKVHSLITYKGKIVVPKVLQTRIVQWYHTYLCHPGLKCTEETVRQHFAWNNLRQTIQEVCRKCPTCKKTKKSTKKYGHLPPKEAETDPWDKLCVDLIGPYTIKNKNKNLITIHAVTMIDPATGWFELKRINSKQAIEVANTVEQTWLTRYPWSQQIVYDQGREFMAEFAEMIEFDYGIKKKPITTRNPQANAIIERIHQTLGNMLRTFELPESEIESDVALDGILSAIMFGLRATYHTTLQASPAQLVFGRDAILNIRFEADWNRIKQRKQSLINKNNERENSKRLPYEYRVGSRVLLDVTGTTQSKYGKNPYEGPYNVLRVNNNGTIVIQRGPILETVNIRNIKPYNE
jgi:transposase InsO family protein